MIRNHNPSFANIGIYMSLVHVSLESNKNYYESNLNLKRGPKQSTDIHQINSKLMMKTLMNYKLNFVTSLSTSFGSNISIDYSYNGIKTFTLQPQIMGKRRTQNLANSGKPHH